MIFFKKPSGNIREKGLLLTGPGNFMACWGHTMRSQIDRDREGDGLGLGYYWGQNGGLNFTGSLCIGELKI